MTSPPVLVPQPSAAGADARGALRVPSHVERDLRRVLRFHTVAALCVAAFLTITLLRRPEHMEMHPPSWGDALWSLRVAAMCVVGQAILHRWHRVGYAYAALVAIPVLAWTITFTLLLAMGAIMTLVLLIAQVMN